MTSHRVRKNITFADDVGVGFGHSQYTGATSSPRANTNGVGQGGTTANGPEPPANANNSNAATTGGSSSPSNVNLTTQHVSAFLAKHHATAAMVGVGGASPTDAAVGAPVAAPISPKRRGTNVNALLHLQGNQLVQQAKVIDLNSPSGLVEALQIPADGSLLASSSSGNAAMVGGGPHRRGTLPSNATAGFAAGGLRRQNSTVDSYASGAGGVGLGATTTSYNTQLEDPLNPLRLPMVQAFGTSNEFNIRINSTNAMLAGSASSSMWDDDEDDLATSAYANLDPTDPDVVLTTIAASDYFLGLKDFFAPPHKDSITCVVVDNEHVGASGRVYTASYDDSIGVWEMANRERLGTLPHSSWVNSVLVMHVEGFVAPECGYGSSNGGSSYSQAAGGGVGGGPNSRRSLSTVIGAAQHFQHHRNGSTRPSSLFDPRGRQGSRSSSVFGGGNNNGQFLGARNQFGGGGAGGGRFGGVGGGSGAGIDLAFNLEMPLSVAVSFIVTGSEDGYVTFWSPTTNKVLHQLGVSYGAITALCAADDVVFAASLRTVYAISAVTGTVIREFTEESADVLCMAFIDGYLFTGTSDGRIVLWDVPEGFVSREIRAHKHYVPPSSSVKRGAVGGKSHDTTPIHNADGDMGDEMFGDDCCGVRCIMAPIPTAAIAAAHANGGIGGGISPLHQAAMAATMVGWTNNGSPATMGAGMSPASVSLGTAGDMLSASTGVGLGGGGNNMAAAEATQALQTASTFSNTFFSAGDDGHLKMWALSTGVCLRTIKAHAEPIRSMTFHYRGEELFVFTGSVDAKIIGHAIRASKSGIVHSAMANSMAVWYGEPPSTVQHYQSASSEPLLIVGDPSGLLQVLPLLGPEANVIAGTCIA